jgi:hypothetical protein
VPGNTRAQIAKENFTERVLLAGVQIYPFRCETCASRFYAFGNPSQKKDIRKVANLPPNPKDEAAEV